METTSSEVIESNTPCREREGGGERIEALKRCIRSYGMDIIECELC